MKNSRKKYLAKNTLIFALGNFGTKIIIFFLVPIYTKVLTTAQYGKVDLISTISMVLAPVLILNASEALLRFPLDEKADNDAIMSGGLILLLFGIVLGLIIIPISSNISLLSDLSIYLYFYVISYACFQVFTSYLRGTEKLLQYSMINILNTLLIAGLNILFLCYLNLGVTGYLLAYIISFFVSAIISMIIGKVGRVIRNIKIDRKLMKSMLKYSVVLIPNTFMWWIINSSDRIMVTSIIGAAANGIYAISYKFPTLLTTFATVFNQAWAYSAIKEDKSEDREEFNNKTYNYLVCFLTITALAMMLVMKPFLKVYVDASYYEAWKYTSYLIIGFVFSSIGSFLATQYTVNKDSKGFLFSALVGAIVNIVLNLFLIPTLGIHGAALATVISYCSVLVYRLIDTKKYLKIKFFNVKNVLGYVLLIIAAVAMYLDIVVGSIIGATCIIVCLWLYRKEYIYLFKIIGRITKIKTNKKTI